MFDHQQEAREVFLRTEFGFDEFFKDECVRATIVTRTSFINVSGTNVEYRYDSDEIDFATWTIKRCLRHEWFLMSYRETSEVLAALYSRKELNFSYDVANAFAGIADRIGSLNDDHIIHGLSSNCMPRSLLWANWSLTHRGRRDALRLLPGAG